MALPKYVLGMFFIISAFVHIRKEELPKPKSKHAHYKIVPELVEELFMALIKSTKWAL